MRNTCVAAFASLCVALSILGVQPAAADPLAAPQNWPAGFPSFSREDVVRVCLSEYGMGNSSVLDCLAQDQQYRAALARKWVDIDDHDKKDCLARLADLSANSYSHLDACVRSAEKEKDAAPD